jgi:hypothetical protein
VGSSPRAPCVLPGVSKCLLSTAQRAIASSLLASLVLSLLSLSWPHLHGVSYLLVRISLLSSRVPALVSTVRYSRLSADHTFGSLRQVSGAFEVHGICKNSASHYLCSTDAQVHGNWNVVYVLSESADPGEKPPWRCAPSHRHVVQPPGNPSRVRARPLPDLLGQCHVLPFLLTRLWVLLGLVAHPLRWLSLPLRRRAIHPPHSLPHSPLSYGIRRSCIARRHERCAFGQAGARRRRRGRLHLLSRQHAAQLIDDLRVGSAAAARLRCACRVSNGRRSRMFHDGCRCGSTGITSHHGRHIPICR